MTGHARPILCDEVVERLWPYLDGALADAERGRVAAHLAECMECTSHFDYAQAFLDAVHQVSGAPPPARSTLRERVLEALRKEGFDRR